MNRSKDNTAARGPWGRPESISWWFLLAAAGIWSASRAVSSGDLWVALGCGRYILSHGVGRTDPFSFTSPPGTWVNQNWLSHILLTWMQAAAGLAGLGIWKAIVCGTIVGLTAATARLMGAGRWAALLAGVGMALAGRPYFDIRPNLHSILLGAILIRWLAGLEGRTRRDWILPVALSIAWANLHGGFLFGIIATGVATVALVAFRRARPALLLLPLTVLAASIVAPYGITNLTHPWVVTAGPSAKYWRGVAEWRPPYGAGTLADPGVRAFWILAAAGLMAVLLHLTRPRGRRVGGLLVSTSVALVAFLLAFASRRFTPLFAVAALPPIAAVLAASIRIPRLPRAVMPALAAIGAALALSDVRHLLFASNDMWEAKVSWSQRLVRADEQPEEAVRYLLGSGARGRLFTDWTWGGYLLNADPFDGAQPRYRIYIDGRAQAAYPASVSIDLGNVESAAAARDVAKVRDFLDRYRVEIALLDRRGPGLAPIVPDLPGWQAVYGDDKCVLVVRDALAPTLAIGPFPDAAIEEATASMRLRTGGAFGPAEIREAFEHAERSVELRPTTFGVTELTRVALAAPADLGPGLRARAAAACDRAYAARIDAAPFLVLATRANTAQCRFVLARASGDPATAERMRAAALALSDRSAAIPPRYFR
jgi:hypothetical protein